MKLLGAVLLFFVCACTGLIVANLLTRRPQELRQLRGAFHVLETEIAYGSQPLDSALQQIGARENGPVGRFFSRAAHYLQRKDGTAAYECWRQALADVKTDLALREQDRHILLRLGSKIGLSDRHDQVNHLRLAQATLEAEEAKAVHDQEKYAKMSRSLGVLLGALLVILLY